MKIIIVILLFLVAFGSLNSQIQVGAKVGVSSYELVEHSFTNSKDIEVALYNSKYGVFGGFYTKIGLGVLSIQPEVLFNSSSAEFSLSDFTNIDTLSSIFSANYRELTVPVLVVVSPSIFNFYAGPVAHYYINSFSAINSYTKITQEFKKFRYGYQVGVGVRLGRVNVDGRYEGNFNNIYKSINLGGIGYTLTKAPARFLISVGYRIL